jgi:hypothetical protein
LIIEGLKRVNGKPPTFAGLANVGDNNRSRREPVGACMHGVYVRATCRYSDSWVMSWN